MAWAEKYVTADSDGGDGSSGNPWTLAEAIAAASDGDRINVKAGTYANTTTGRDFNTGGSSTAPVWWRGYKTTIGDQDTNPTAAAATDIPLITFTSGQMLVSSAYQIFSNIAITSECTTTNGALYVSAWARFYRCRLTRTGNQLVMRASSGATYSEWVGCYFSSGGTSGILELNGAGQNLIGCYIGGGSDGVTVGADNVRVMHCIFDNQSDDAIVAANRCLLLNNSIYSPAGNGINVSTGNQVVIANNYFEDVNQASKYAINNTSGADSILTLALNNAYYNCTGTTYGLTESFAIWDQGALASAAFTDPANDDFRVGTVAKAIGFPGSFENLSSCVGYLDVGALQRVEPTGGGGGAKIIGG